MAIDLSVDGCMEKNKTKYRLREKDLNDLEDFVKKKTNLGSQRTSLSRMIPFSASPRSRVCLSGYLSRPGW